MEGKPSETTDEKRKNIVPVGRKPETWKQEGREAREDTEQIPIIQKML